MSRIARLINIGYPHHVVQRGNNKAQLFFDDKDRLRYLSLLKEYSQQCACKVHAYCLMNDHVHLLLTPQNKDSLAKTMQKVSLCFTQYFNKKYRRIGRLWACRFHSSVVDPQNYLWITCRYIERHSVRAGITKTPSQYEWSSIKYSTVGVKGGFVIPVWEDETERKEYINFVEASDNEVDLEKIRTAARSNKPIGSENFLKELVATLNANVIVRPRGRPKKDKQSLLY